MRRSVASGAMRTRLVLGLTLSALLFATPPAYAVDGTLDFNATTIELSSAAGQQSILVLENPADSTQIRFWSARPMGTDTPECGGPTVDTELFCNDVANRSILVRTGTAADTIRVLTTRKTTVQASGGADEVLGGDGSDQLLGQGGSDTLLGGNGSDALKGGGGGDSLVGGPGKDGFVAGGGSDYVGARDGVRETIDCGTGKDYVVADRRDVVKRNCETVRRG